ncbi:hypothetical protein C8Q80DRAFT_448537 [Daedaleopsis nitida]|nr:hypothetical protein C8Q80DRAFT_448537 [Daedaleopsis nitida]
MRTLPRSTVFAALIAVVAALNPANIYVDDSDSRIEYVGSWVKNPISDPANFNYGGSLSFTNSTEAKASFTFSGAVQVAVFGSCPTGGTFTFHSQYTIDDSDPVSFMPPGTITKPEYRVQFYASTTLTPGTHTLTIENLGQEFYLDYILLTPVPASASSDASPQAPTVPTPVSPTSTQSAQLVSHESSSTNTPSDIAVQSRGTETTDPGGASQSATASGSVSYSATLTSSGPFVTGSPSSSSFADGTDIVTPSSPITSTSGAGGTTAGAEQQGSQRLMSGAYIAIGIASFMLVIISLVGGACLWRRRRRTRTKADVIPFGEPCMRRAKERRESSLTKSADPGLMSLASDDSEKRMLARDSDYRTSLATTAPPYSLTDNLHRGEGRSRRESVDGTARGLGDRVQDEGNCEQEHTELAGYEALASPPSTSPLISPQRRSALSPTTSSPIAIVQPRESRIPSGEVTNFGRRRSLDGGVRIAGGPPGMRRVPDPDLDEMEVRSAASTLPPLYQPYLSS